MIDLQEKSENNAPYIVDGTDESFAKDVIEASSDVPVIVDFWAPWCGPCKTLGPALEAAVNKAKSRVKMVKIDIDQNQAYAQQLRVQSVPTVYAFHNGQPVDGFQGALPHSEIDAFVDKIAKLSPAEDEGLGAALEAAQEMLDAGSAQDAIEVFLAVIDEVPSSLDAHAGLMKSYLSIGSVEKVEDILSGLPVDIASHKSIEAISAQVSLAREAESAGPVVELKSLLDQDENNHQARLDYAIALHAEGEVEAAIAELLELFRRDREWNDGAAREQLFKVFDALPANDPLVLNGRRKLSSLVFA